MGDPEAKFVWSHFGPEPFLNSKFRESADR